MSFFRIFRRSIWTSSTLKARTLPITKPSSNLFKLPINRVDEDEWLTKMSIKQANYGHLPEWAGEILGHTNESQQKYQRSLDEQEQRFEDDMAVRQIYGSS